MLLLPAYHVLSSACRHIFQNKQYTEEYRASDFELELGLDRERLVRVCVSKCRCRVQGRERPAGASEPKPRW